MEIEQVSSYGKQIDDLLVKEKTARINSDNAESVKILKNIIKIAYDLKEYEKMFELMILLAKRRGQSKKAQVEMVQQCMEYVKEITDLPIKLKLIETIRDVCDKKIYLEVEYARCCLLLVKHKEDDNMIEQAASILQEVQVETYGSMDKREKLEFILYQMKIMIKKKDYVRLYIISKKINQSNLDNKEILDLKITYYAYLIEYYNHEQQYMDTAICYQKIFQTLDSPDTPENLKIKNVDYGFNRGLEISYKNILENYIAYLVISSFSEEQYKLLKEINKTYQHKLENYPQLKNLIAKMLLEELIPTNTSSYNIDHIALFTAQVENSEEHKKAFRKQLVQKNIRIIEKYYENIRLNRLSQLLGVSEQEVEDELCEMINEKIVTCKIDRMDGTISFKLKKSENSVLNTWSNDTNKVLDLIDQTCNLIKMQEEGASKKK